jgi:alpha-mannosidase
MEEFRKFDQRRFERINRWLKDLKEFRAWRNARVVPIDNWTFTDADGNATDLTIGEAWPVVDPHRPVTLAATAEVPFDFAGQPIEIQLWLGGEGFVSFTPGYQSGLNPFHNDFPISHAATGGETIDIFAEVIPKGFFGSHVHSPSVARALVAIPHLDVRALESDLRNIVEAAEQLKEHDVFSHLLDIVDATWRELAPYWPTSTEIAKTRYISGDIEGGNRLNTGLGDYGSPGYEGGLMLDGIWHIPPPTGSLQPLDESTLEAVGRARALIAERLEKLKASYPPVGNLVLTGHAHIDLAWLWPVAETRRKVRRTFSSVLRLMNQYPDFTFNQSSAQAYSWLQEDDPDLLEEIKERVEEGRWEVVGGSWLEPDSQVTGGEAYVRHLFYGQRFFQDVFGIRNNTAWLPDVFGFSGNVPQILKGAGIDKFFTIKVNWSEVNTFPFDLFNWKGIDGSTVIAHTFNNPGMGYNGNIAPLDTAGTWRLFSGKRFHSESLLSFGYGDGGGGPSEQMLENYARIKDFPALPALRMGKVEDFFTDLPSEGLPTYTGELYLELHRATLTTQGLVKKLNREAEHRLVEAEAFSAIAALGGSDYPHDEIDGAWKKLLLNQFHDILPGSSIHEVYDDAHASLGEAVATATSVRDRALGSAGGGSVIVANPLAWERPVSVFVPDSIVTDFEPATSQKVEGGTLVHHPDIEIGGYERFVLSPGETSKPSDTVSAAKSGDSVTIENNQISVIIGADGTLHRVFDKLHGRESLADRGNQLWAYVDRPRSWDAWDIDESYPNAGEEITTIDSIEVIETGPLRSSVRVTRTWRSSTFVQTYRLTSGSRRLDIDTTIDWHERLVLVRAQFPTSIHAHEATFETMFGVHRRATHQNTTYERARFEVGAHRFVDLSEPDYGVALLNDGKYGYSAVGGTIGVSLVRGSLFPDPLADEGHHAFTYSLYPHEGNWVTGGVVREAQALNAPLVAVQADAGAAPTPAFLSLTGTELGVAALKQAHDQAGIVVRVYEPHGVHGASSIAFDRPVKSAKRVNLLEEATEGDVDVDGNTVTIDVGPFELVSLLVEL